MLRSLPFYVAVCCGALALANLVWAQPPSDSKRSVSSAPALPSARVTADSTKLKSPALTAQFEPKAPPLPKTKTAPLPIQKSPIKKIDAKKVVPVDPIMPVVPKVDVKVLPKRDIKVTEPLVLTKPIAADKISSAPAIKLAKNARFDVKELTKIKPPVDLTKISGEKLVKMKPPADFKAKKMDLAKIQVPADAFKVGSLNAKMDFKGQKFILNNNFFKGNDYHLKFGVKHSWGWCYHGHHHCHWHHSIWDPCCGCYYYYDPCCSCYYYWSGSDNCYYPCWWFVDYCDSYYPWWLCGGFEHYGYHCHQTPRFAIRIGW